MTRELTWLDKQVLANCTDDIFFKQCASMHAYLFFLTLAACSFGIYALIHYLTKAYKKRRNGKA